MTAVHRTAAAPRAYGSRPARPLRITIVANEVRPIGGTDLAVRSLVAGLAGRGHLVTVISRSCELPAGVRVRHLRVPGPERPFTITYPWFVLAATAYAAVARGDILHTTGAVILGRADICTVHALHVAAGRAWNTRSVAPSRLRLLNAVAAQPMKHLGERLCYRPSRIRRMVVLSEGQRLDLATHFPRMTGRTVVVPNGVDALDPVQSARYRTEGRRRLALTDDDLVAIFVGEEWERKRLGVALDAVLTEPRWHLLVVGRGEERPYRERAAAAGASDRVHFLGRTQSRPWYAAADAFLLPSLYESFSLTPLEAAAAGLPLLVSRVHGLDDLLVEGRTGWFVGDDVAGIAEHLRVLQDPQRRRSMGEASRVAASGFRWDRVLDAYEELYASLLEAPFEASVP